MSSARAYKALANQSSSQISNEEINQYKKKKYLIKRPDLYFPCASLVVEIDGDSHFRSDAEATDRKADYEYSAHGISVYRIPNSELDQLNLGKHIEKILDLVRELSRKNKNSQDFYNQKAFRSKLLKQFLKKLLDDKFKGSFCLRGQERLNYFLREFTLKELSLLKNRQKDKGTGVPRVRSNGGFRSYFNNSKNK